MGPLLEGRSGLKGWRFIFFAGIIDVIIITTGLRTATTGQERTETTNDIFRREYVVRLSSIGNREMSRLCELCVSVVGNRSFLIKMIYRPHLHNG